MMSPVIDQIVDILAFRDRVLRTGMNPSTTAAEDICKELYPSCYSTGSGSGGKKQGKKGKGASKAAASTAPMKDSPAGSQADAEF